MADDKAKLLQSLAIDRGTAAASHSSGGSRLGLTALGAAGVAVLGVGLWAFLLRQPEPGRADPSASVAEVRTGAIAQTQPVAAEPSRSGLAASGYVVARRKATVAAEVTGKVVELSVEEGMIVRAGQVIARLDSKLAETDLVLAQSRVTTAESAMAAIAADLQDAERILKRTRSLSEKSYASEADLTKAEAKVGILSAQLKQAQAQLQTARLDVQRNTEVLDKHTIRAPFGGVVVERSAQPGEMISPISAGGGFTRTGICTIVDMDSIEIEVDVNEAFIGRVRTGHAIAAVLDAYPDWTIPAAVIAVVPTANREKATVKVRIGLKQKDPRILPDMAVKVTFVDDQKPKDSAGPGAVSVAN